MVILSDPGDVLPVWMVAYCALFREISYGNGINLEGGINA
jgi:hypothetical protein